MNKVDLVLNTVERAHPSLMEKTSQIVEALRELDPDAVPGLVQDIRGSATALADGISDGMGKTASVAEYGKNFALALGGAVAAGAGAALAADAYSSAKGALTRGSNFKRMIAHDPELSAYDHKKLRAAFDAVHHYGGSEVTSNPMVASAATKSFLEAPSLAFKNMQELAGARKTITETTGKYFGGAGAAGQSLVQTRSNLQQQAREEAKDKRFAESKAKEIAERAESEADESRAMKVRAGLDPDFAPPSWGFHGGDPNKEPDIIVSPKGKAYGGQKKK